MPSWPTSLPSTPRICPPWRRTSFPISSLAGEASARLVTAVNVDLGVDLAVGSGNSFTLDTETWLRLNRFDAGIRLALTGVEADLSVAGLANMQVREGVLDLRAAAQVALNDPDNSDELNRLTSTDRAGLAWSDLIDLTTTSNLRGSLLLERAGRRIRSERLRPADLDLPRTGPDPAERRDGRVERGPT